MKMYPSIPAQINAGLNVIAFNKLDGSNIRAEWSPKKGFYKYGTRKRLLGADDKPLGEAIGLIESKYADALHDILKQSRTQRAICFFEFWGEGSAFGHHRPDVPHDVTLIDVALFKQGVIAPNDFLKTFGSVDHAEVLYRGPTDYDFVQSVRDGTLEGMGPEGVVCKAGFDRKLGHPIMFKVKRQDWYERLREHCGQDEKMFQELS